MVYSRLKSYIHFEIHILACHAQFFRLIASLLESNEALYFYDYSKTRTYLGERLKRTHFYLLSLYFSYFQKALYMNFAGYAAFYQLFMTFIFKFY